MNKNKEWSNEELFLLIDLYKEKPSLWNPRHQHYKLKTKRNDCWREIGEILNSDVNIVKKKIESLLTSFRRERQKCEETKKSGAGLDEIYTSTWFAFEKMKFLLDKFTPRPTQDTMDDSEGSQENFNSHDSDDHLPNSSKIFKSPKKLKQMKNNILDKRAEVAYNHMQDAIKRRNERDQSTIFGEYVANKHRSYSSHTKSIVEHMIANIFFDADMGNYENNPVHSPTSHYSQQPCSITQFPYDHLELTTRTPTSPPLPHWLPSRSSTPFSAYQTTSESPTSPQSRTPTPTSPSSAYEITSRAPTSLPSRTPTPTSPSSAYEITTRAPTSLPSRTPTATSPSSAYQTTTRAPTSLPSRTPTATSPSSAYQTTTRAPTSLPSRTPTATSPSSAYQMKSRKPTSPPSRTPTLQLPSSAYHITSRIPSSDTCASGSQSKKITVLRSQIFKPKHTLQIVPPKEPEEQNNYDNLPDNTGHWS